VEVEGDIVVRVVVVTLVTTLVFTTVSAILVVEYSVIVVVYVAAGADAIVSDNMSNVKTSNRS